MKVEITLPKSGKLSFNPPKKINFGDVVFKCVRKEKIILNISQELKIEPEKIYNCLKKLIGERVKKAEVIAEKKGIFSKKTFKSPFSGKIIEINHHTGTITLEVEEIESFKTFQEMTGRVLEKKENKIVVDLKEPMSLKLKKVNFNDLLGGNLTVASSNKNLTKEEFEDKIVLIEKTTEYLENKLSALGVKALITLYQPRRQDLPFAQLINVNDFNLAFQEKKKYALIDPAKSMLYIYN